MEFLVDSLKRNAKAVYADLKAKADEKKLKVFPVMFGRAKLLLGLVKAAKRGTGKFAQASAAKRATAAPPRAGTDRRGRQPDANSKSGKIRELLATGMSAVDIAKRVGCTTALVYNVKARAGGAPAKRGPGRPPKAASTGGGGFDGLSSILDAVKNNERERTQLRSALERIQSLVAEALA
jgi:uncharacterized protein YoaH (UPF0181 family)